jgi:hypothetical protein
LRTLNKRGGTSRDLNDLNREFWLYALERELTVVAVHLPGIANEVVDEESRHFRESAEWSLCPLVAQDIFSKLGEPEVDLFASCLNHKLPKYFSYSPDPFAAAVNSMSQNWSGTFGRPSAVPPCGSDNKVLVAPVWTTQPYWPLILRHARGNPLVLPHWVSVGYSAAKAMFSLLA